MEVSMNEEKVKVIAIISGIVLVVFGISTIIPVSTTNARVTGAEWSRTINIEHLDTLRDSGWSHPSDAYNITCSWRTRSRQVPYQESYTHTDTYRDSKGHTTTRSSTKYRTKYKTEYYSDQWYEYTIDRWRHRRDVNSFGSDFAPYWPKYELGDKERTGRAYDSYALVLSLKGTTTKYSVTCGILTSSKVGAEFKATLNMWGSVLSIERLM